MHPNVDSSSRGLALDPKLSPSCLESVGLTLNAQHEVNA